MILHSPHTPAITFRLSSALVVSLGKKRNEHKNKIVLAQADLQSAD
jgi:hypothetical protein